MVSEHSPRSSSMYYSAVFSGHPFARNVCVLSTICVRGTFGLPDEEAIGTSSLRKVSKFQSLKHGRNGFVDWLQYMGGPFVSTAQRHLSGEARRRDRQPRANRLPRSILPIVRVDELKLS